MGTETRIQVWRHSAISLRVVKLNNPPMGTETLCGGLIIMFKPKNAVKLNNPPMGTETPSLKCHVYNIGTPVKLNNPPMGTETLLELE